jgi:hypothetical protein
VSSVVFLSFFRALGLNAPKLHRQLCRSSLKHLPNIRKVRGPLIVVSNVEIDAALRAAVVERLCEYMVFRSSYENAGPKEDIPVQDLIERIPPEVALELLVHYFITYILGCFDFFRLQTLGCRLSRRCVTAFANAKCT